MPTLHRILKLNYLVPPHIQLRISGMSWPCLVMYALCSMSLSRISCFMYAATCPNFGTLSNLSYTYFIDSYNYEFPVK